MQILRFTNKAATPINGRKTLLIAIHRDSNDRNGYADSWAACLEARCCEVRWVDLTAQDALDQVQGCDGVMWHLRDHSINRKFYWILTAIEQYLGIAVFPSSRSFWCSGDKVGQYYLLQAADVPMPKTWIFWDKKRAREWALQTDYPKIFKLSGGGASKGLALVSSAQEACRLIDGMFGSGIYGAQIGRQSNAGLPRKMPQLRTLVGRCKAVARYLMQGRPPGPKWVEQGYVYFQEFIPRNDYKTNIKVMGDRAYGLLRFNRPNDFRSSAWKSDYDPLKVDLRCVQMAFDISKRFGFQSMVYDFLFQNGEPVVLEMSIQYPRTYHGYWKRNLEWVNQPIPAQEAQVEEFLNGIVSRNGKGPKTALSLPLTKSSEFAKARHH